MIELTQFQKDLLKGIQDLITENPKKYFREANESRWRNIKGGKKATRKNSIYIGRTKPFGRPVKTDLSKISKKGLYPDLESLIIAFNDTLGITNDYYIYDKDLNIKVPITNLINRNLMFKYHQDRNNKLSYSYLIGFGDYDGGELEVIVPKKIFSYYDFKGCKVVEEKDDDVIIRVDIKNKLFRLPLRDCFHKVNEWKGDRYSLIIYTLHD